MNRALFFVIIILYRTRSVNLKYSAYYYDFDISEHFRDFFIIGKPHPLPCGILSGIRLPSCGKLC